LNKELKELMKYKCNFELRNQVDQNNNFVNFLRVLYKDFYPKNLKIGDYELPNDIKESDYKKLCLKSLSHYHPDK